MNSNKFTPQEKEMPEVRLPMWLFWLCCFDLFTVLLVNISIWSKTNHLIVILISLCFFIPALIGIAAYRNCVVRFDKDFICCRNFFRKIRRYTIEQITDMDENGIVATIYIEDVQIPVSFRSQNGKWLQKLIAAKIAEASVPKETQIEATQNKFLIFILPVLIVIFSAVAIAVSANSGGLIRGVLCGFCGVSFLASLGYTLPFLSRKLFYDQKGLTYINCRKEEHRYEWADLTSYHSHNDVFYFSFGESSFIPMMIFHRKDFLRLDKFASEKAEGKIAVIGQSKGDLAADRAYLEMFYRQKKGILFRHNFLNHIETTIHILMVTFCAVILTFTVILSSDTIALYQWIFLLFIWAIIPLFTLTYMFLERMPMSYVRFTKWYYPLSLDFLEKLPPEKRAVYADLVLKTEELEKLDLARLFPITAEPTKKESLPYDQQKISAEEVNTILKKDRKERKEKEKKNDRIILILCGILLVVLFLLRVFGN